MAERKVSIAVVGCGAVTERGHLPVAARNTDLEVSLLVDKNRSRAEVLSRQYSVPHVAEDWAEVPRRAEIAIVALPHYLHARASVELLRHGVHVLVEKPMAVSALECDAMIRAAEEGRSVLAVGLLRRFQRSARFTKAILEAGLLGGIESFDIEEGLVYEWPVASDFPFRRDAAGGGVLIDTGAHALDTVLWWLGHFSGFEYSDDNYGGVEADCEIRLVMKSGAKGVVKLSRIRRLRGTAIICGTRATLEVSLHSNQVRLRPSGMAGEVVGHVLSDYQEAQTEQSLLDLLSAQIADWVRAIKGGQCPCVPGAEGRRSVALIEACYAQRKPLMVPWMAPNIMEPNGTVPRVAQ